jgi:hypothetical protein
VGVLIWDIFIAAVVCHLFQGLAAAALALSHGRAALHWGIQSALLGFPSSRLLVASCLGERAGALTPVLCISLFLACLAAMRLS